LILAIIHDRKDQEAAIRGRTFQEGVAIIDDRESQEPAISGRTFQEGVAIIPDREETNRHPRTDGSIDRMEKRRPGRAALLLRHRNAAIGLGAGSPQVYIDRIAGGECRPPVSCVGA
jgi:hypothetical protein